MERTESSIEAGLMKGYDCWDYILADYLIHCPSSNCSKRKEVYLNAALWAELEAVFVDPLPWEAGGVLKDSVLVLEFIFSEQMCVHMGRKRKTTDISRSIRGDHPNRRIPCPKGTMSNKRVKRLGGEIVGDQSVLDCNYFLACCFSGWTKISR